MHNITICAWASSDQWYSSLAHVNWQFKLYSKDMVVQLLLIFSHHTRWEGICVAGQANCNSKLLFNINSGTWAGQVHLRAYGRPLEMSRRGYRQHQQEMLQSDLINQIPFKTQITNNFILISCPFICWETKVTFQRERLFCLHGLQCSLLNHMLCLKSWKLKSCIFPWVHRMALILYLT